MLVMRDALTAPAPGVAETHFCRHPEQLRAFIETAVPTCLADHRWFPGVRLQSPLRILSAGCASGEEVYTLALLLRDDNSAALDLLAQNAAMLQAALGSDFRAMERSIRNFDFEEALESLVTAAQKLDIPI